MKMKKVSENKESPFFQTLNDELDDSFNILLIDKHEVENKDDE